jgi:hypothetical protein
MSDGKVDPTFLKPEPAGIVEVSLNVGDVAQVVIVSRQRFTPAHTITLNLDVARRLAAHIMTVADMAEEIGKFVNEKWPANEE